jgi:methionyl-tRNA formyltransferase
MHQKAASMPNSKTLRIIFAGTPEFASTILDDIVKTNHNIVGVFCRPDRPKGRGQILTCCPVKESAINHKLNLYQPESLNNEAVTKQIRDLDVDVIVVVAYGQILPLEILNIPKYGCLNVHASLLPRWRGAAPIQRAILAGDNETGVGVMLMDEGLDTGKIMLEKKCIISDTDNSITLHDKLADLGSKAIIKTLSNINKVVPIPQNENGIKYAKKLLKQESWIDWNQSALNIHRKIRAFNPYPIAQTYAYSNKFEKRVLRIINANFIDKTYEEDPGTIVEFTKNKCIVAAFNGSIELKRVQLSGKKSVDIGDFNNAYQLIRLE